MIGCSINGVTDLKEFIAYLKKYNLKFEGELISYLKDEQLKRVGLNLLKRFHGFGMDTEND